MHYQTLFYVRSVIQRQQWDWNAMWNTEKCVCEFVWYVISIRLDWVSLRGQEVSLSKTFFVCTPVSPCLFSCSISGPIPLLVATTDSWFSMKSVNCITNSYPIKHWQIRSQCGMRKALKDTLHVLIYEVSWVQFRNYGNNEFHTRNKSLNSYYYFMYDYLILKLK